MRNFTPLLLILIVWMALGSAQAQLKSKTDIQKVYAQLLEKATASSPDGKSSQANLKLKKAGVRSAWAAFFPRLDLAVSQGRVREEVLIPSLRTLNTGFATSDLAQWSANLRFPLYNRGVLLNIDQSRVERELAQQQAANVQSEMDWNLRSLFAHYLLQMFRVTIFETSIKNAQNNLKEAKLSFTLGKKTKVDVLRSETNLVGLESKKAATVQQRGEELDKLLEFSGIEGADFERTFPSGASLTEMEVHQYLDDFTQVDARMKKLEQNLKEGRDLEQDLVTSPVYLGLQKEIATLNTAALKFRQKEFPELVLQGALSERADKWGDLGRMDQTTRSIALVLNIPLFSGGSFVSSLHEEVASFQLNRIKREREILRLENELKNDGSKIKVLKKNLEGLRINVKTHEEIYRLVSLNFKLGNASIFDLLNSQDELLNSKISLAETEVDLSLLLQRYAWKRGWGVVVP